MTSVAGRGRRGKKSRVLGERNVLTPEAFAAGQAEEKREHRTPNIEHRTPKEEGRTRRARPWWRVTRDSLFPPIRPIRPIRPIARATTGARAPQPLTPNPEHARKSSAASGSVPDDA